MIAIDWGTSSFRAYRLDGGGGIVETRTAPRGILNVKDFPQTLEDLVGGWLADTPIVMSGMVGSRQGWVEVPYVPCPAGFDEIAAGMREIGKGVWIVPGVSSRGAVPDVMRGEETQVLGCGVEGTICLPGTHSKWVEVEGGRIQRFSTHMTGEVFAVLRQHSILGRMMEDGAPDVAAFAQGVRRSGDAGGLLHHLFGTRTRGLMGELTAAASPAYLSGILIGHELRARPPSAFSLIGEPALAALYRQAAGLLGMEARELDAAAGTRALFRLGGMLRRCPWIRIPASQKSPRASRRSWSRCATSSTSIPSSLSKSTRRPRPSPLFFTT